MAKGWTLSQHEFDALLAWLDPERGRAALRYEEIRTRLIRIFMSRGSSLAEELADETFNRVARKLDEITESFSGDPALYFYGVGKNILRESMRTRPPARYNPVPNPPEEDSAEYGCLEKCMQGIVPEHRRLILDYYRQTGLAKIHNRKRLAADLGVDMNMLRVRTNRIRARLRDCVRKCMEQTAGRKQ